MFIPLTINNALKGESWPNLLIAGDTAEVFYLLSMASALEANVFLADTGIKKPLREFPCHRDNLRDRANVYYDFFDGRIGAGIVRRMDAVMCATDELRPWARLFHVPFLGIRHEPGGIWLGFEGLIPCLPKKDESTIAGLIAGFVETCRGPYATSTVKAFIDHTGEAAMYPGGECLKSDKKIIPQESSFSAWDGVGELLKDREYIALENEMIDSLQEDRKLVELGVPELDVLAISGNGETKYVELTGDLTRVFDGLF